MRNKKTWAFWIVIVAFYGVVVSTVIVLDISLHWGLVVGLKILALIHILLIAGIVTSLRMNRKQD